MAAIEGPNNMYNYGSKTMMSCVCEPPCPLGKEQHAAMAAVEGEPAVAIVVDCGHANWGGDGGHGDELHG